MTDKNAGLLPTEEDLMQILCEYIEDYESFKPRNCAKKIIALIDRACPAPPAEAVTDDAREALDALEWVNSVPDFLINKAAYDTIYKALGFPNVEEKEVDRCIGCGEEKCLGGCANG